MFVNVTLASRASLGHNFTRFEITTGYEAGDKQRGLDAAKQLCITTALRF
jgi:hypothetical protein